MAEVTKPAPVEVESKRPTEFLCEKCGNDSLRHEGGENALGFGCLLVIIGVCLIPVLIGIPLIILGLYVGGQPTVRFRVCQKCGHRDVLPSAAEEELLRSKNASSEPIKNTPPKAVENSSAKSEASPLGVERDIR
jgi:hypothetical protein